MKAFRVRGDGTVESGFNWKGMDGIAYVPVGGGSRSYASLSAKLATASEGEGRVYEVDFRHDAIGGIELVPPCDVEDKDGVRSACALVIIPTGGYDFGYKAEQLAVNPRCNAACRIVVLQPGEEIRAFPKVRNFSEANAAKTLALRFDGKEVTFAVA